MKRLMRLSGNNRIWEIDFIRGICILLVILDHTMFDFAYFVPSVVAVKNHPFLFRMMMAARYYWELPLRSAIWAVVVGIFVFLCGISTAFSESNFRRGFRLAAIAAAITTFTAAMDAYFGERNYLITAGVIQTLAVCILLYSLISLAEYPPIPYLKKLTASKIIMFVIICVGVIMYPYLAATDNRDNWFLYMLGAEPVSYMNATVYSADYIPLLPWMIFFFMGAMAAPLIYGERKSVFVRPPKRGFVCFVGKHSLIIYLAQQLIFVAVFYPLYIILTGGLP